MVLLGSFDFSSQTVYHALLKIQIRLGYGYADAVCTSDAPWLDADQLVAWRGLMDLMQRLPAALDWQLQQDAQLSFIEYYVLASLSDQPGRRMRMGELAVLANVEPSRLSHMVTRLEKRGFLRREPEPCNGRYTHAILTDTGHAHLVEAAPGHVKRVRELFVDALDPEELRALRRCSGKVIARIDSAPGPAGTVSAGRVTRPTAP
jgi:DNA-binding MarR family transcriptional regulator